MNLLPPVIQGLQAGWCDIPARRVGSVRGGDFEDEQRPPNHVAGGSEWMVSRTATTGWCC